MRGQHHRKRAPKRFVFLRVFIALAVPVVLVAQPTSASPNTPQRAVARISAATQAPVAIPVTVPSAVGPEPATIVTLAPPTTAAPPTTLRARPASAPRSATPAYGADAAPVALTFDDGPNALYTPKVLDILARYGLRATFFVVGSEVERLPALTRRIISDGHVLGNHTWDHADLTTLDDQGFRDQVDRTEALLGSILGTPPNCVRPPFGRINAFGRSELLHRGLAVALWTKDTEDWKRPGTTVIVQNALAGARPGGVILFHDSGPDMSQTVAALPAVIEGILGRGLRIAPICQEGARVVAPAHGPVSGA